MEERVKVGQALYRKYRPQKWDEAIGQEHVVLTLQSALKTGRIGHAYLFSGPRGVGKTTVARLLARQINNLKDGSLEPHIDIIEIDAASNTSVEDVRDLREKVAIAPSLAKYKIYIIDEVHMLSKSAFNALLKTLEEPPAHVIFILATTDPQKLPETIISRTQHFVFRPIATDVAVKRLQAIARAEKIELDAEAAKLIALLGDGSFRDSVSLLDQLSGSGQKITRQLVEDLAGLPPSDFTNQLAQSVDNHEPLTVVKLLNYASVSGYQAGTLAKSLSEVWRAKALESSQTSYLSLVKQLMEVPTSHHPEQLLELILLEAALNGTNPSPKAKPPKVEAPTPKTPSPKIQKQPVEKKETETNDKSEPKTKSPKAPQANADSKDLWSSVLERLRSEHPTLYSQARLAHPHLDGDTLNLEFAHKFQYERLKAPKNRDFIKDYAFELTGRHITIACHLNPDLPGNDANIVNGEATHVVSPSTEPAEPSEFKTINDIFGGSELLQS